MRLGVVMTGAGAHAGACIGVLQVLEERGIHPYAVCGLSWGAWPAAMFAAGVSTLSMEKALHQAAHMGRRMIAPRWYEWLNAAGMTAGQRLNHLLAMQTGGKVLSLCPGAALFPCRMLRNGQRVVFSTRAYMQDQGAMLAMQAGVGFAARAAMGLAPFLEPMQYMGSHLLGDMDTVFACRQLMLLGAHRVLLIDPQPSPGRTLDSWDMTCAALRLAAHQPHEPETAILRITMPESAGVRSFSQMEACMQAGKTAASRELDELLDKMGMARCRVLAFRRG